MRYAPTLVRLKSWIDWGCVGFVFAHMRAYAIRPYSFPAENDALWGHQTGWCQTFGQFAGGKDGFGARDNTQGEKYRHLCNTKKE